MTDYDCNTCNEGWKDYQCKASSLLGAHTLTHTAIYVTNENLSRRPRTPNAF